MLIYTYRADWVDDELDAIIGESVAEDFANLREKVKNLVATQCRAKKFDKFIDEKLVMPTGEGVHASHILTVHKHEIELSLSVNPDRTGCVELDIQGKGLFLFIFNIK